MGTRYLYWTPSGSAPNDGVPPGLEPPEGPMFAPQFSPFGMPGPLPFGPPFEAPPGFPGFCGRPPPPPPPGLGPMACFPNIYGAPPPGPGFFPVPGPFAGPPPPYTPNPWGQPAHTREAEQPPAGARINGQLAQFDNRTGHIFSKDNTTFHLVLVRIISHLHA